MDSYHVLKERDAKESSNRARALPARVSFRGLLSFFDY